MRDEQADGPPEEAPPRRAAPRPDDVSGLRGSRSLPRDLNASLLIELVRRFGPISRAELSRQSQISAPTVSAIVGQLLARGTFSEVARRAVQRRAARRSCSQLNPRGRLRRRASSCAATA